MHLPNQYEALNILALHALKKLRESDTENLSILTDILVSLDHIKPYAELFLSQPDYISCIKQDRTEITDLMPFDCEERKKSQSYMDQIPHLTKTFKCLSAITLMYCQDLHEATKHHGEPYARITERLLNDAEQGFFEKQLLPKMLAIFDDDMANAPDANNFANGLTAAIERDVFTIRRHMGCPMGRGMASMFRWSVERISPNDVRISEKGQRGNFPAFLSQDIRNSLNTKTEPEP